MKKFFLVLIFMMIFLNGCQKNDTPKPELLPAAAEPFSYEETKGTSRFTVDENGSLYILRTLEEDFVLGEIKSEEDLFNLKAVYEISVYDLEGNCVDTAQIKFGSGSVSNLEVRDNVIYCVSAKNFLEYQDYVLYAIRLDTWEVTQLAEFPDFKRVDRIVLLGDYVYVFGEAEEEQLSEEIKNLGISDYYNRNNALYRTNIAEEKGNLEKVSVNYIRDICRTEQDTLMMYCYNEEQGRKFLEFDQYAGTLQESVWEGNRAIYRFCDCREGFITFTQMRASSFALLYVTKDGIEEAQVLPEGCYLTTPPVYVKGFLFYIDQNGKGCVERICLEDVMQENKTLRVLMLEEPQDLAYGCGFRMENRYLTAPEFSLKVLARDKDFDIFMLSSRDLISYNIKENGGFYPLNDVEGVQEYLDACFPYLKDLATDGEGNIWMIPVKAAISGLAYNEELCEEQGVDYSSMDWNEFLEFTVSLLQNGEGELFESSMYMFIEQFFGQYLSKYDTFDTEVFRTTAKKFHDIVQKYEDQMNTYWIYDEIVEGKIPEFYYQYLVYSRTIDKYAEELGTEDAISIIGIPKLSGEMKNAGTLTFLAVNPESNNRKTALDYISAYAKYMMTVTDSYLLQDEEMYTDTSFVKAAYDLYAEADIYFQMPTDIYLDDFKRYVNGKMGLEEMISEIERKYEIYTGE